MKYARALTSASLTSLSGLTRGGGSVTAWTLYLGPVLGRWRGQTEESGRTQVENAWPRRRDPAGSIRYTARCPQR